MQPCCACSKHSAVWFSYLLYNRHQRVRNLHWQSLVQKSNASRRQIFAWLLLVLLALTRITELAEPGFDLEPGLESLF